MREIGVRPYDQDAAAHYISFLQPDVLDDNSHTANAYWATDCDANYVCPIVMVRSYNIAHVDTRLTHLSHILYHDQSVV